MEYTQKIIDKLGVPQLVDLRRQLPVNKNYTWADLAGTREYVDLDTIALHHDAYPKQNRAHISEWAMMTEIANSHIKSKKYDKDGEGGIPYHFYVMRGKAYYVNDISWRVYGVWDHNGHTIHICVHGDYVKYDSLTDVDRKCIMAICLMLMNEERLTNLTMIKGHKELNETACPGYDYESIRNDVQTLQMKMKQEDSWEFQLEEVKQYANQINYMMNLLKAGEKDGDAKWGMHNLLQQIASFKASGLL